MRKCRNRYWPRLVDHWLVWKARMESAAVVDVFSIVTAIHRITTMPITVGAKACGRTMQAQRNYDLAGGQWHMFYD